MTSPVQAPARRRVEHRHTAAAPPAVLYDLVSDVTRWPAVFGPTVDVRVLEHGAAGERFEIWALVNGEVAHWRSRREFDPVALSVGFAQERSQPPVAAMGGRWSFLPAAGGTEILLEHDFAVVADIPGALAAVERALDANSRAELAALARIAEFGEPLDEVVFSFSDTVELPVSVESVYEFIDRADLWAERLPHVSRSRLREEVPGVQLLEMDTVTSDGSAHTTNSVRLCTPNRRIVFKQRVTPRIMLGHTGEWSFARTDSGAAVTVTHTVALDPTAVSGVLGADASLADARAWATEALRQNSRRTLSCALEFADGRSG